MTECCHYIVVHVHSLLCNTLSSLVDKKSVNYCSHARTVYFWEPINTGPGTRRPGTQEPGDPMTGDWGPKT